MKVLNKGLKILLLGTTLMTSAKAADLTQTAAQYASLASKVKIGVAESDKAVEIADVSGGDLDKSYLGTVAASNESYILMDNASKLRALAIIGGKWCTFESSAINSNISSSGQIHLIQTIEDGDDVATKKLTINLIKRSGAAQLTPNELINWLKPALKTAQERSGFSAGSLTILSNPKRNWYATALFQLVGSNNAAGAALAATLDPIAFTLTAPVTPAAGGSAVNFTATLSDISEYSFDPFSEYDVALTHSSDTLTLTLKPDIISSHSTGIMAGLVSGANDLERRRLKTTSPYTYALPADSASAVLATIGAASSVAIAEDLAAQHARLATDPTAGSTDTLKEAVDVIVSQIGATSPVVQTGLGEVSTLIGAASPASIKVDLAAQHARLATNPANDSTDTVKEAIDVVLTTISGATTGVVQTKLGEVVAAIGATSPVVQTGLGEVSTLIGASSPASIKADLAAQNARLATTPSTLKSGVDGVLAKIGGGATNVETGLDDVLTALGGVSDLKTALVDFAESYVSNANFLAADCSVAVETNKYGAVAFTSHNITSLTGWHNETSTVVVSGQVNGVFRTFTCDVTNKQEFSSSANQVLKFTSSQGDVFWIKAFDATGLDASALGSANYHDDFLAALIADKFSGVTAIDTKTLPELRTAAS